MRLIALVFCCSCAPVGTNPATVQTPDSGWTAEAFICDPWASVGCRDRSWIGQCGQSTRIEVLYVECVESEGGWASYSWSATPVDNDCDAEARVRGLWEQQTAVREDAGDGVCL